MIIFQHLSAWVACVVAVLGPRVMMIARALVAVSSSSGLQKGRTCNENMSERVRCTSLAQGAISILASSLWRGKVLMFS